LHDAKEFVGTQPERFPNKIIFAGDANRFICSNFEFFNRGLRTIPVFPLVLGAAIDIHQQRVAVRRNAQPITAVHARIS